MLRKDILKAASPTTADPAETARFDALAAEWWKPDGAFKTVHAFNRTRVAYLAARLPDLLGRDALISRPLGGLTLLDVGCGAGLVAEPMAGLGAAVTGIDASARNVAVAGTHAAGSGLAITYRQGLPEHLVAEGRTFDIVLSLEVVEHVADVPRFLAACAGLVAPGGVLVIGTLNRTVKSFALAIVGAEYVLRWLPRGTHDWRKFVTPAELEDGLGRAGLTPVERIGVVFDPLGWRWRLAPADTVNYLASFRRPG